MKRKEPTANKTETKWKKQPITKQLNGIRTNNKQNKVRMKT